VLLQQPVLLSPKFGKKSSHIFTQSPYKKPQYYTELTVRPAKTNSLWTISLMSKKAMSMLLTLLFTCLAFFGLDEFGLSVYGSCFLPRMLV
jgi:hypothetical protein